MPNLLSTLEVKGLVLKNRIVMPPMANNMATEEGKITPGLVEHYLARAKAEVGLLIVEHAYVAPMGRANKNQLGVHDDRVISELRELVDAVHAAGARIGSQITHAGGATTSAVLGTTPEAPSAVQHPRGPEVPRELGVKELAALAGTFAAAARRVKTAGFDMVEIHGAHGYLLNQFYSPLTNRRKDAYGGDREKRLRFPLEVVEAVRLEVGPDFPVFYRLGADDLMPGGLTAEDAKFAAPRLVEAGVDLLDVSGGLGGSRPEGAKPGYFVPLAVAVKSVVQAPVLVTGGIREPAFADQIIRDGKADLVGIGRALLADPEWARKAIAALR